MNIVFVIGIAVGLIIGGTVGAGFNNEKARNIQDQAECRESLIRDGRGLYCPDTGKFALIGECGQ